MRFVYLNLKVVACYGFAVNHMLIPVIFSFGVLIATKAAMLASALLVIAIPLFNERNKLLNLTWFKVKLLVPTFVIVVFLIVYLIQILESVGIWYRLVWFYEKKGMLGIFLSGRDEFVAVAIDAFYQAASIPEIILGMGQTGLGELTKSSMEVDPIDMYFWFGILGLGFFAFIFTVFTRISYLATREKLSVLGPGILVINLTLFAVSIIAGHILTSGMLGPLFGLVNGMAYADYCLNNKDNPGKAMPL